ncbi:hypothetical protein C8T65DRAFT_727489 [Cerioporus squamosus]|nr:hypothetical protein C8T65DRAFT_727489 [Cerioporus squamosus]
MTPVTVLQANLATICFSSALYGIFFVLTVTSLAITIRRHKDLGSAAHIPTSAARKSRFRFAGPWTSPLFIATTILLLVISAPTAIALNALTVVAVLVCDLMLIYRTWVIWNRRHWIAVLPLITTTALTAVSIAITYLYSALTPQRAAALSHFITGGCILTLSTNFLLHRYDCSPPSSGKPQDERAYCPWIRESERHRKTASVIHAIAVFSSSSTESHEYLRRKRSALRRLDGLFLRGVQVSSAISALANACMPFVAGISLSLITVRVALGWAHRGRSRAQSAGESVGDGFQGPGSNRRADAYPLRTITLNVSTTVEQETDSAIHGQEDKRGVQF